MGPAGPLGDPLRYRFRKKVPIIPGLFHANLSRSGISWSLTLGRFTRTWGHGRVTTSLDTPGPGGFTTSRRSRRR